jgi:hypothetical protein
MYISQRILGAFRVRDAIGAVIKGADEVIGARWSTAPAGPPHPGHGPPIEAGEFLLGYLDQTGRPPPMPQPEALGRNSTYAAFRKLHLPPSSRRAATPRKSGSWWLPTWSGAGGRERRWYWRHSVTTPQLAADPKELRVPRGVHIRPSPTLRLEEDAGFLPRRDGTGRSRCYGADRRPGNVVPFGAGVDSLLMP